MNDADGVANEVEAHIMWNSEPQRWLAEIDAPDGPARRLCKRPAPLLQWIEAWGKARHVDVTVAVWLKADR